MTMSRLRHACLGALLVVISAACARSSDLPAPTHVNLEGSPQAVVSAFNADRGKVRALFIASPT